LKYFGAYKYPESTKDSLVVGYVLVLREEAAVQEHTVPETRPQAIAQAA
jgi:hypothetical protein